MTRVAAETAEAGWFPALRNRGTSIVAQGYRFLTTMGLFLKDLYHFNRRLVWQLLALSLLGTGLQGFSLGATFYVLNRMDEAFAVTLSAPALGEMSVHAGLLIIAVLGLFAVSVWVLFAAERVTCKLSLAYANATGAALLMRYPFVATRFKGAGVRSDSGVPVSLTGEVKTQSLMLERAVRSLLGSPTPFLQIAYGVGFLIYFAPVLTGLLVLCVLPLLLPLWLTTRTVKDAEKARREAGARMKDDIEGLAHETAGVALLEDDKAGVARAAYERSAQAESNFHRYRRLVAQLASRSVATTALSIAGAAALAYFWVVHGASGLPLALIVSYFVALRITLLGGRQAVARMARFARFYDTIRENFSNRQEAERGGRTLQRYRLRGPDLAAEDNPIVTLTAPGPHALAGRFPLLPVNRYLVAAAISCGKRRLHAHVMSNMALADGNLSLPQGHTWRDFLSLDQRRDSDPQLHDALASCCHFLDGRAIADSPDQSINALPMREAQHNAAQAEAWLLRAWATGAPIVVVTGQTLAYLGPAAANAWRERLRDRLLLCYYQIDADSFDRWGEHWLGLIGADASGVLAMAAVAWAHENRGELADVLKGSDDGILAQMSEGDADAQIEDD